MSLEKQLNAQKEPFQQAATLDIQQTMAETTLVLEGWILPPKQGYNLKTSALQNQHG